MNNPTPKWLRITGRLLSAIVIASTLLVSHAFSASVELQRLQKKQRELENIKTQVNETKQTVFSNLKKILPTLIEKKIVRERPNIKKITQAQSVENLKTLSNAINDINMQLSWADDAKLTEVLQEVNIENKEKLKDFLSNTLSQTKENYQTLIQEAKDTVQNIHNKEMKPIITQLSSCTDIAKLEEAQAIIVEAIEQINKVEQEKKEAEAMANKPLDQEEVNTEDLSAEEKFRVDLRSTCLLISKKFENFESFETFAEDLKPLVEKALKFETDYKMYSITLDAIARKLYKKIFTVKKIETNENREIIEEQIEELYMLLLILCDEDEEEAQEVTSNISEKVFYLTLKKLFKIYKKEPCFFINSVVKKLIHEAKESITITEEKAQQLTRLYSMLLDAHKTIKWVEKTSVLITPELIKSKFPHFRTAPTDLKIEEQCSPNNKLEHECFTFLQNTVRASFSDITTEIGKKRKSKKLSSLMQRKWKEFEPTIQQIIPDFEVKIEQYKPTEEEEKQHLQWVESYIQILDNIPNTGLLQTQASKINALHFHLNPGLCKSLMDTLELLRNPVPNTVQENLNNLRQILNSVFNN